MCDEARFPEARRLQLLEWCTSSTICTSTGTTTTYCTLGTPPAAPRVVHGARRDARCWAARQDTVRCIVYAYRPYTVHRGWGRGWRKIEGHASASTLPYSCGCSVHTCHTEYHNIHNRDRRTSTGCATTTCRPTSCPRSIRVRTSSTCHRTPARSSCSAGCC